MTAEKWLTLTIGVITVVTAFAGSVRWLVKHYFQEIKSELKPNGGGSLKDTVNRLEEQHLTLNQKIDRMYDILLEHVSKHN